MAAEEEVVLASVITPIAATGTLALGRAPFRVHPRRDAAAAAALPRRDDPGGTRLLRDGAILRDDHRGGRRGVPLRDGRRDGPLHPEGEARRALRTTTEIPRPDTTKPISHPMSDLPRLPPSPTITNLPLPSIPEARPQ